MRITSAALVLTLITSTGAAAQATLRPLPSSRATTEIVLNYPAGQAPADAVPTSIRVDYGVPHLRGRPLHTEALVPYDVPWRTGANNSTTLKTDVDIMLGGTRIAKGTYVLFTLPSATGWKLIVQRSEAQSAPAYDAAFDVARIDFRRTTLAQPLESLTMWLIPSTEAGGQGRGELRMSWGTFQLSVDWAVA